ncbi:MAG: transcriptional regulator [Deltaproteobacteria bacterium]|nr:transcriptional regulator [Deltaproteobacteria bacterium]
MNESELEKKLNELLASPGETEWLEFKEAKRGFDFNELGKYFSALSNEANLRGRRSAWLIFGVKDNPRQIIGSEYRPNRPDLDSLKHEVANQTTNRITFTEIYELKSHEGRVILFEIPAALRGVPTAWKGHYYGRDGESLGALSIGEIEKIRGQAIQEDWSAQICTGATIDDLNADAVLFARTQYKEKHPAQSDEVDEWDDMTFLNKAKVCISGRITNTAIILLGKNESAHFLSPSLSQITWILRDKHGVEQDYEHFGPPLLLTVDRVFTKIRNLTYRYLPNASLFPTEVKQYDSWVIRETLHNCIAHQDYLLSGRINMIEEPDLLLFTNVGKFIPGSIEEVIRRDAPPEVYRNPFLAQAMVNLNMIDTIGSGIKRMFLKQRQRFFPMPDYNLSESNRVEVRVFGKILDENYTRRLIEQADLSLVDVIALDKVQKKLRLRDEEFKRLKARKMIEGRRPNLYVSADIAALTEDKATYIKHRAFDKDHYKKLIVSFLEKYGEAKREDIDELLLSKLSDALSEKQKKRQIMNLLQEMRREGLIEPVGTTRWARWVIPKTAQETEH